MGHHNHMNLKEILDAADARKANGNWYPAGQGTEEAFWTRTGRHLQYMWQPSTGRHAYLDLQTDTILSDDEAFEALDK